MLIMLGSQTPWDYCELLFNRLAVNTADTRLQNDYKILKAKKKEEKMNAAMEVDNTAKRKAARKVGQCKLFRKSFQVDFYF